MFTRRFPITLGVVMILLLVVLIVGWVLLAVLGALTSTQPPALFWAFLSVGSVFYVLLLVGVSLYLGLSVKAINLTRRQSNFIDAVTHELKSPIASMKLYLQTLSRHQVGPEEQTQFHRAMLDDLDRLDQLVDQMLDAGRVETPPAPAEPEPVSLPAVLRDATATVCLRYRTPLEIVRLDLKPCAIKARQVDLGVIFRNLIDNAVKYAGNPPEVRVTLRRDAETGVATVRVRDNGRGIPMVMRRKVFGRFVRLGSELERDRAGTGLGLYIVRTLLRRLHGRIHIEDPPQGPGIVFEVQLRETLAGEE
ncbi:MAG: HAMP domain-containing histidine kinase [Pirellulales bacterium]|nr:HAMP domain-containing histidine kinase [Pirellulales bacterium]